RHFYKPVGSPSGSHSPQEEYFLLDDARDLIRMIHVFGRLGYPPGEVTVVLDPTGMTLFAETYDQTLVYHIPRVDFWE
ncbi:MAG: hypothetical protein ACE5Z5_14955, partial [Candidatus Bathyarchaeia archaeon]